MSIPVYIFSGLGADERVFRNMDFTGYEVHHIAWIKPYKNETLSDYAKRISTSIDREDIILIGLSFGGMVAMEVARQIKVRKLILLSTGKTKNEVPFYFRFAGKIGLTKFIPVSLLKRSGLLINWFFGAKTAGEKKLLQQIVKESDNDLLQWAIGHIARRDVTFTPLNAIHIHGTADRIFPVRFVRAHYLIEGGTHLMTLQKPEEIMKIIREYIEKE